MSNFIPNRFRPKFEIVNLYLKVKDSLKAKDMAKIILKMPVKIKSEQIDAMQFIMGDLLKSK